METDFIPLDLYRMFLGDGQLSTWAFVLEVIIRTSILFVFTAWFSRSIGGSIGDLGPFDIVIIVVIGTATGDPMIYPAVPILHGMLVISVILVFARAKQALIGRSTRAYQLVIGSPSVVVRDGEVVQDALGRGSVTRVELDSLLRNAGIKNVGEVQLAVFEPTGKLSVFRYEAGEARQGDSVIDQLFS